MLMPRGERALEKDRGGGEGIESSRVQSVENFLERALRVKIDA